MSMTPSTNCPYKGLQPYTEEDRKYFFGRERDKEVVASNLYVTPLTVLYGGSGVGKSSVLQAGVIPKLRAKARAVIIYFNEWQSDAFDRALKRRVLDAVCAVKGLAPEAALAGVRAALDEAYEGGERAQPAPAGALAAEDFTLDDLLLGCARGLHLRVLLIFDQFEEYFLYHTPGTSAEGFDAEFARAVNQHDDGVNFMISMREEELSKLDRFRVRIPNLLTNLLRLENLDRESAAEAITRPLDVYNEEHPEAKKFIEPQLVEAILEQVAPESLGDAAGGQQPAPGQSNGAVRIETPFLQVVLTRLWEEERRKGSDTLTLQTLDALGGAKNIARTHLDEVMSKLSEAERDTAAAVLRFLVTPAGAKIAQQPTALAAWAELDTEVVGNVLKHLSARQEMCILRKVTVPGQEERYELFHDVLGPAILNWQSRYTQARRLARQRAETEEKQRAERKRRRARLLAIGMSALVVLLLGMGALTAYALNQQTEAERQKTEADRQRAAAQFQQRVALDALAAAEIERDRVKEQRAEAEGQRAEAEKQKKLAEQQREEAEKQKRLAEAQREEALRAQAREAEARRAADALKAEAEKQKKLAEDARDKATLSAGAEKLTRLGMGELRSGDIAQARDLFNKASIGYKELDDVSGQTGTLANVAETYAVEAGIPPSGQLETLFTFDEGDDLSNSLDAQAAYLQLIALSLAQEGKKKLDKEQLEKLARDEQQALASYREALRLNEKNPQPDLKFAALIEKRLGGIHVWSGASRAAPGDDTPEGRAALESIVEGIRWYVRAADSYARAGQHEEGAAALRSAASLTDSFVKEMEDGAPPAGIKSPADYYEQAAAIYERSGKAYDEAVVRLKVGALYKKSADKNPDDRGRAVASFERALSLLRGLSPRRPEAEAIAAGNLADVHEGVNKEQQLKHLVESLEARIRLDSSRPQATAVSDFNITHQLQKLTELYGSEADGPKADAVFRNVVAAAGDNLSYKALLLKNIGELYGLKDKPRALGYYARRAEAWAEAKNPLEESKAFFELAGKHVELKDNGAALKAYDRALQAYARVVWKSGEEASQNSYLVGDMVKAAKAFAAAGDRERAARTFREALAAAEAHPTLSLSSDPISVMGDAAGFYLGAGDEPGALAVFRKSLEAARRPDSKFDSARALATLGDVYAAAKTSDAATRADYDRKALGYYEEARLLHRRERDRPGGDPLWAMRWTLKFYTGRQDRKGAVEYLTRLADSFRQAGDARGEADVWMMFGEYYVQARNYAEAVRSYDRVRRVDPNTPADRQRDINFKLRSACAAEMEAEDTKEICASVAEPEP